MSIEEQPGSDLVTPLGREVDVVSLRPAAIEGVSGVFAVHVIAPNGVV